MMRTDSDLRVFSGTAHSELTRSICRYLQIEPGQANVHRFSDGEIFCKIDDNIRGADIFLVQPTGRPTNVSLMELLIMLDAFRRASPGRISAVIPYFGYARQDRKDTSRVPITAKLVANLLTTAGADRVLTIDLHAAQIQGFFDIPVDHLYAAPVLIEAIREFTDDDLLLVSPDAGGVERTRAFAKRLGTDLAIVDKRRHAVNQTEVMNVIGDVRGRSCMVCDDIIDTAGTLVRTAEALIDKGAARVMACGVHPVFSGPAIDRIEASPIEKILVTDTLPLQDRAAASNKIEQLSLATLLGEAIKRIHEGASVSSLFV